MQTLQINSTLQSEKYTIKKVLGQGGFGITYLAEHNLLGTKVAIKEFFMKELNNREESTSLVSVGSEGCRELVLKFRDKFIKEARNIARLNHPNIIRIHDIFVENGTAYYVMEYCEGESLNELLKKHPEGLGEALAVKYIRQVASALQYIHERKMNHLDVKPANIMLNAGNAVLIDFGLSKQYDSTGSQTSTTPVGISHGFAPIEQYKQGGVSEFSPATDIYSLGATLYKLITGQTPPDAQTLLEEDLPMINVSASVANAIRQAMQVKRSNRPQSIAAWLQLLDSSAKSSNDDESTQVLQSAWQEEEERRKKAHVEIEVRRKSKESKSHTQENKKSGMWKLWGCVAAMALIVIWFVTSPTGNTSIDKNRVERLISNICRNSSKGGDFNALRDYFTDEIFPHPSGEKRYNHNIGEKMEAYVNRFPQYKVSNPHNFTYENTSFPIVVNCDVMVDWINTKGVSKQELVHKTYYITSDYKVSGFTDSQSNNTNSSKKDNSSTLQENKSYYDGTNICPKCNGKEKVICPRCNGTGEEEFVVPAVDGSTVTLIDACSICEGSGEIICMECQAG